MNRPSRAQRRPRTAFVQATVLLGWSFACSVVNAATPAQLVVDGTRPGPSIERVWPFFGFDEVNYTTTSEGAALLQTLAEVNSARPYVRSHFLLNTGDGTPAMKWGSTNVYTEDAMGNPVYDFTLTDGILDAITRAGTLPFVELGFMPEALSSHPEPYRNSETTSVDGGCFYPPSDYAKWGELIRVWATHAAARYPDVPERWLWELWNEPDVNYWRGTFDEYAKLYDFTEAALHGALPGAILGGPAVASPQRAFLKQFLEHCASGANAVTGATGTRLDLVSFHSKGGVFLDRDHVAMDLGNQLRLHQLGFNTVAGFPEFRQTPIYITEADPDACAACPLSANPGNAYRLSTAYGAYELAMMKHSLELEVEAGVKLGGVLTWAFTFPGAPYFAGYRALADNGIHLPVLGAFQLLGKLAGARLPLSSTAALPPQEIVMNGVHGDPEVDGMATLDGETLRILVWSYHDEIARAESTPVHVAVSVPGSFGKAADLEHLRVDEAHGDAYQAWLAQGSPSNPNAEQINALRQAMDPSPASPSSVVPVMPDGSVSIEFDLPRFGISLLTLRAAQAPGGVSPSRTHSQEGCGCRLAPAGEQRRESWLAWLPSVLVGIGFERRRQRREKGIRAAGYFGSFVNFVRRSARAQNL